MAEATQSRTQARTVMVDGQEMDAEKAASIHEVREIFSKFKKALKTIALYRHNVDRYGEYLEPVHSALADFLARKNMLQLRVEAMSYMFQRVVVFEDDSRDNNIVFPFWQAGIRLFIFKAGLSPDELLKFLLLVISPEDRSRHQEDIITRLWKAEFESIEYIVVEGFKALPDDDVDEVEMEVEKVVAYLYRQLQSNSQDYLRFARISSEDLNLELNDVDQLRGVVIQGVTTTPADMARVQQSLDAEESRVLPKMVVVLFQLLDALLLAENFTAIHQIRERFGVSMQKPKLKGETRDLVQRCAERFNARMAESQRLQTIAQILNSGNAKDPQGVKGYLTSLGLDAIVPLLEMLESLELPPNRRLVADVLADLGRDSVSLFTSRLTHPSSNLVKEVLYIIDKINPPEKFALFSHVLKHPNAVLRLETLALIGRNEAEECFETIKRVFLESEDPQMRAQAARLMPYHMPSKSVPVLMAVVNAESFERRTDAEKKAMFAALAQIQAPEAQQYLRSIFEAKSSLFSKKHDELKLLAIAGLEANPSLPALQMLAEVAKDPKKHAKEVCEAARAAAIQMKTRLLGA